MGCFVIWVHYNAPFRTKRKCPKERKKKNDDNKLSTMGLTDPAQCAQADLLAFWVLWIFFFFGGFFFLNVMNCFEWFYILGKTIELFDFKYVKFFEILGF